MLSLMDIGALPRRCRPFSLTESGPLKSRTKHNNGVRVHFPSSTHEQQYEALGFMDRRCVGKVERELRPFVIDHSYIGRAAINSTFTGRLESHKDCTRHGRRALVFSVNNIVSGSLGAVDHLRFLAANPSTHDPSSLGRINHGLRLLMSAALTSRVSLPPMLEAPSRAIRKLRLA